MVTWQGASPSAGSSASSAGDSSSQPQLSPADQENPGCADEEALDEEALRDTDDLADRAEAELAAGDPGAAGKQVSAGLRAERLRADQLVIEAVLEEGLGGPRHQYLQENLIRYAIPVLRHLLADGRLVSKATRLRRPPALADAWLYFTEDDRAEFAQEMVVNALPGFNKVVFQDKKWTPAGGASLKTYFVNACILNFARLQARWLDDRQAVRPAGLELDPDPFPSAPDPAATVAVQDEVRQLLRKIEDHQLQEVMVLRGAGWTAEAAAREAGLTTKAAEGRLARFRKDLKEERAGTEPHAGKRSDTAQGGR